MSSLLALAFGRQPSRFNPALFNLPVGLLWAGGAYFGFRPPPATAVDADGLKVRRLRMRRIPWQDVAEVPPVRQWDDFVTVRLHGGESVRLVGFPKDNAGALAAVVRARRNVG
ncbi:MAG: PH domain-containing protein [Actinomycetota bacterium]|nr:PH domain-containing protein [Actinomycetota bacterium]